MRKRLKSVKPMTSGVTPRRRDWDGYPIPPQAWIMQGPYSVAGELDDVIHIRYNKAKGRRVYQLPLNWEFAV